MKRDSASTSQSRQSSVGQSNVVSEGWTNVTFSDKANLGGPYGYQFYWHDLRLEKESFYSRNLGAGTVMI